MPAKKGKKRQTTLVRIDADLHRRLKIEAARRGASMIALGGAALQEYLSRPSAG